MDQSILNKIVKITEIETSKYLLVSIQVKEDQQLLWEELYSLKEHFYSDIVFVEIFPPKDRLINNANVRHLYHIHNIKMPCLTELEKVEFFKHRELEIKNMSDEKLTPKEKAKEMINKIYQPLGFLQTRESSDKLWEWSKDRVLEQIELLKSVIPMYTGELNPLWRYYSDVENEVGLL